MSGKVGLRCAAAGVAILLGLMAGAPAQAADVAAGEKLFKAKCAVCHRVEPGRNAIGPSLHGVVGRAAGTVRGFSYSPALKQAGFDWTPEGLDKWLRSPKDLVPGTRMPFAGMPAEAERSNLIAYLATLR